MYILKVSLEDVDTYVGCTTIIRYMDTHAYMEAEN